MKFLGLFLGTPGKVINVFWLVSIVLTGWTHSLALRLIGVRWWLAFVGGVLYAFLPYGAVEVKLDSGDRYVVFDLRPVEANLRASLGERDLQAAKRGALSTLTVEYTDGFYPREKRPDGVPFRPHSAFAAEGQQLMVSGEPRKLYFTLIDLRATAIQPNPVPREMR